MNINYFQMENISLIQPTQPKTMIVTRLTKYLLLFSFGVISFKTFGQMGDTSKMSSLMVYGDDFMFTVKEPGGWIGDIDNAEKYYSNIIFYKSKADIDNGGALIQVYNFKKTDEETHNDLEYDIKSYRDKYANLKEKDLSVSHKEYKCYSKTVYVENNFYQYLVYVNPGAKYKSGLSVAMNISKRPATEEELKAFNEIITSLVMLKG